MSKYDQLVGLVEELLSLFVIEYEDEARKTQDARIIVGNLSPDSLMKIKQIILNQGLLTGQECIERKFFRYVIGKFSENDEVCTRIVQILAKKFLPHLAAVCPVSDLFMNEPYEYIKGLDKYDEIGLCFDKLNYVLQN